MIGKRFFQKTEKGDIFAYTLDNGKDGALYKNHQGVCLETQVFPNFTKYSHFPNGFLRKCDKYYSVTEYGFSNRHNVIG